MINLLNTKLAYDPSGIEHWMSCSRIFHKTGWVFFVLKRFMMLKHTFFFAQKLHLLHFALMLLQIYLFSIFVFILGTLMLVLSLNLDVHVVLPQYTNRYQRLKNIDRYVRCGIMAIFFKFFLLKLYYYDYNAGHSNQGLNRSSFSPHDGFPLSPTITLEFAQNPTT